MIWNAFMLSEAGLVLVQLAAVGALVAHVLNVLGFDVFGHVALILAPVGTHLRIKRVWTGYPTFAGYRVTSGRSLKLDQIILCFYFFFFGIKLKHAILC